MSRLSLCFLIAVIPSIIAHVTIFSRQDVSAVGTVLSTTTSSFNWWPYPSGGITTSVSFSVPTLVVPLTSMLAPSSSAAPVTLSPSTSKPTASSHSSVASHKHTTTSTSSPVSFPSSDPQSLLKPGSTSHDTLWLVPVCLLSGAVIGCAGGWLAWRHFGEKRDKIAVGYIPDRYAWAYKRETVGERDDHDREDVEYGYGQEYLSPGKGPSYHVEQGNRRLPSTASTSGARTWVGHRQPRKRSGLVGAARTSPGSDQEHDGTNCVRSPLLTQISSSDVPPDSKPLPASPLPSSYSYGDDEGDVASETVRHKSVRRRIWERLGFAEGDMRRKNSQLHDGEGRHTWSAGATQARGADLGRSLSFWGRRKTMKEGRVERWVRGVRGQGGDMRQNPEHQQEVPMESMDCGETPPQLGTPELVLSTLRRVSPSAWHSQDSDGDLATAFSFDEKSPDPYSSTPQLLKPTSATHHATTRSSQRRSLRDVERRARGVSLQDPGPMPGSDSVSRRAIVRTSSVSKNASQLRSTTTTSRSKHSQRSISIPTPPSPSSVSRYSATPHVPALSTLNRSPTRIPMQSNASRDLRTTLTRAAPSSRLARPVSGATPSARGSSTPPRTRPLPGRCGHTRPQQHLVSELPAGPSSVVSPSLQSALCFDEILQSSRPSRAPTGSSMVAGTRLPASSRGQRHSAKRVSTSGSTPPNARTAAIPPRSSHRLTEHTPVPVPAPRPLSAKERYLARQNANARVGMILSRSYSSRNFDERPMSPTMFGAVINEEFDGGRLEEEHSGTPNILTLLAEGGAGIEQRLDRLRKH